MDEWYWMTLDIGNMFGLTLPSNFTVTSIQGIKITQFFYNLVDFYLPIDVEFAQPYSSLDLAQNL